MKLRSGVTTLMTAIVAVGCIGDRDLEAPGAGDIDLTTAEQWVGETEIRIGSIDDPEQALSTIGHVVIGPGGELFVSQPESGDIRVFNTDGKLSRVIGRRGKGPGEFENVSYIGFKGDTLFASDDGLERVSYFSPNGKFWRTDSWRVAGGSGPRLANSGTIMYLTTTPHVPLPDGTGLAEVAGVPFSTGSPDRPDLVRSIGPWNTPYLHVDSHGEVMDTIVQIPERWAILTVVSGNKKAVFPLVLGAESFVKAAFPLASAAESFAAVMRDGRGVVVVDMPVETHDEVGTFKLLLIDPSGDSVFTRTVEYVPVPTPDETTERIAQRLHQSRPNGPGASAIAKSLRESGLIPGRLPPVSALAVAQDGSIWLRREDPLGDSILWNVFSGHDGSIAAIRLPAGDSVIAARDDVVVALARDELDVPYLTRYRLNRSFPRKEGLPSGQSSAKLNNEH